MERLEVYPFQRVEEPIPSREDRRRTKNNLPRVKLELKRVFNAQNLLTLSRQLKALLKAEYLLLALGAIIMSRAFILGELLPFIYAFVAVFAVKDKSRSLILVCAALLGLSTVLQGVALLTNILAVGALALVLNYIKIEESQSWWELPLITLTVVILVKTIAILIGGINFYQEMVAVFEAMISAIITFVFLNCSQVIRQKKAVVHFSFEEMAAFMVMGLALIMGLNDIRVAGLEVSSILCRLGIMTAAYFWGMGGGTIMGVMSGIIPSIASSVFAQTLGIYSLSGLLAGAFRNFGRLGVIIGFMLGNLALSMFISESQVTILGMWETVVASILFFLLPESLKDKLPYHSLGPVAAGKDLDLKTVDSRVKQSVENRIHHLAQVFDELSSTFAGQPEGYKQRRGSSYISYLYDELAHGFCDGCTRFNSCWHRDYYNTSQEILDLFSIIENKGQLTYEDCPPAFKRKCINGRELITTLNYLFDNLRVNEYWSEKMDESRELVARQLKGVSQVVRNLAEEIDVDTFVDLELRDELLKSCKRMGINLKDITPLRIANEQVLLNVVCGSCIDGQGCELSIAPAISSLVGHKLEVQQKNCPPLPGQGACEFTLARAFTYQVNSAAAQVAREELNGDCLTITTLKSGQELIVLGDGMGVGEKAWEESNTAVRLLEDLLDSGFDQELALKTVNSVLLLRSQSDTFTTVDMVMIDLYTGDVDFFKTAGAPSFIKRGQQISVINSSSLPLGILEEVEPASAKGSLLPRDMIIMVSDGVMEVSRLDNGAKWITDLLRRMHETEPQQVADLIINQALNLADGKPHDDMTVICLKLELI